MWVESLFFSTSWHGNVLKEREQRLRGKGKAFGLESGQEWYKGFEYMKFFISCLQH
ncbi:hypothetical protein PITCH_A1260013 [uncultured Desulfobacterium sp.]|uniref:Uncharacterized protein n=1 Tax=uncultured Desulfobacterium sp. TaxID=201089 RepID=A0A445MRU4_9BACT|nr:hypothetical protein PITCH_A1260013 [uncultured Desulfobacterium sp.]